LKHHPDRHSGDESTAEATARFQQIAEAYYVLSDQTRRQLYDETRRSRSRTGDTSGWAPRRDGGSVNADHVFGNVFEDMLRPEVDNPKFLWTPVGALSGAAIGFIVGNIPGAVIGGYGGSKLGAIRDNKGVSVYEAFSKLSRQQKSAILSALAAKVLSG